MAAAVLRTRLQSAASALTAAPNDALRARISAAHSGAVRAIIGRIRDGLKEEDVADLSTLIMEVPWCQEDANEVLMNLLRKDLKPRKVRRAMQDFTLFYGFFSEQQWKTLLRSDVCVSNKVGLVVGTIIHLGGRCVSEHTKKLAGAFLMEVSSEEDKLSSAMHKIFQTRVSEALMTASKSAGDPDVYLTTLPEPSVMESEYPDLFKKLFPVHRPVPCKINQVAMLQRDCIAKCRGVSVAQKPPCPTLKLEGPSSALGQCEQFAAMMMRGMEQVQSQQQKVLEMCLGGGLPRSLSGLQPQEDVGAPPPRRSLTCLGAAALALENVGHRGPQLQQLVPPADAAAAPVPRPAGAAASLQLVPLPPAVAAAAQVPPPAGAAPSLQPVPPQLVPPTGAAAALVPPPAGAAPRLDAAERKRRMERAVLTVQNGRTSVPPLAPISGPPPTPSTPPRHQLGRHRQRENVGNLILGMVAERDAENAAIRRQAAAKTARAKASPKGKRRRPRRLPRPPKAEAKVLEAQADPKAETKVLELPLAEKAKAKAKAKPSFAVERSRSQVMCRTGLSGTGQTQALKYGLGQAHSNEKAAIAAARVWVQRKLQK